VLKSMFDKTYDAEIKSDPATSLTLEGFGYRWFRVSRSQK